MRTLEVLKSFSHKHDICFVLVGQSFHVGVCHQIHHMDS